MILAGLKDLTGNGTLLAELAVACLLLGVGIGAVLKIVRGGPGKSWSEQRETMVWVTVTMAAAVSIVLIAFVHQRARVTADWSIFELEFVEIMVLFVVFMLGLVGSWNLLGAKSGEKQ